MKEMTLLEAAEEAADLARSWIKSELEGTSMFRDAIAQLDPIDAAIAKAKAEQK